MNDLLTTAAAGLLYAGIAGVVLVALGWVFWPAILSAAHGIGLMRDWLESRGR